jgi:hypothetical protein
MDVFKAILRQHQPAQWCRESSIINGIQYDWQWERMLGNATPSLSCLDPLYVGLFFYPDTLLKVFIRSMNLLVECLCSYMCEISSSSNMDTFTSSFHNCITFIYLNLLLELRFQTLYLGGLNIVDIFITFFILMEMLLVFPYTDFPYSV